MIVRLSNAGCVGEVLEVVAQVGGHRWSEPILTHFVQSEHLERTHLTQAVATIHHLQKISQHLSKVKLVNLLLQLFLT